MSAGGLLAVAVSGRGLVDPGEPVLAADDEGFTRGRAAFETMRVYDGRPFRLAEHLARLQGSAERIGLERPDAGEFEALAALALERAEAPEAVLRLYWSPGPPGGEHRAIVLVGPIPGLDRGCPRSGPAPRLAAPPAPVGAVAAPGDEVDELRRRDRGRVRGEGARSGRRRVRRRRRDRARGAGDEHLVARGRRPADAVARGRHPRRRDPCRSPRARARRGTGRRGGRLPARAAPRADEVFTSSSVREVMPVVVAGRASARARPGGGGAPGRSPPRKRAGSRTAPRGRYSPLTTRSAQLTGSSRST